MKRRFFIPVIVFVFLQALVLWPSSTPIHVTPSVEAQSTVCGTPGKDGNNGGVAITGIVNRYWPGNASAAAGATSITLGTSTGAGSSITSGDLLLVIQMQDADFDRNDDNGYGDNVNGDPASGFTNINQTGRYEFIRATNTVGNTGGTLNLQGAGTGAGLINAYRNLAYDGSGGTQNGKYCFQVIRVPQYTSVTLGAALTALAWNGRTGGVLVIDVSGTLTLGNGVATVTGLGFRGAAGRQLTGDGDPGDTDYVSVSTDAAHGVKGEGICGTPRYTYDRASNTNTDNTDEGYPAGCHARGAPGNAGGGGNDGNPDTNDQNSGGGGGSNCGAGGQGGNAWSSNEPVGGFAGVSLSGQITATRIFMGGGGGSGTTNNGSSDSNAARPHPGPAGNGNDTDGNGLSSAGAPGGGIVIFRSGAITGTGTINANGQNAYDVGRDGAGGGGGGGTVIVAVSGSGAIPAGLTVNARGGEGGNCWLGQAGAGERHGPGGGGGGGVIMTSSNGTVTTSVAGGIRGLTTTGNDPYNSANGSAGCTRSITLPEIPGVRTGSTCPPVLTHASVSKFGSTRHNNGTAVEWSTNFEMDNLGFNVYREAKGGRQKLTPSPIAGSALFIGQNKPLSAGRSYRWIDTTPEAGAVYWVEEIALNGQRTMHGPVVPETKREALPAGLTPSQTLGSLSDSGAGTVDVIPTAKTETEPSAAFDARQLTQFRLAGQPGLKINVTAPGWHRIPQSALAAFGSRIVPSLLQMYVGGEQIAVRVTGQEDGSFDPGDTIEFYAEGTDTAFTNTQVYWLIVGTQPGLRIPTTFAPPGVPGSQSFVSTVERKDRSLYFAALLNGDSENFFGQPVTTTPSELTLNVPSPAVTGEAAFLDVRLQGVSDVPENTLDHRVAVTFNGQPVGQIVFDGRNSGTGRLTVPSSAVLAGNNTVGFTGLGGAIDVSLIDTVRLTYRRAFVAADNRLFCTVQSGQQVTVGGFTARPRVMNISSRSAVKEVTGTVQQQGANFSITFTGTQAGEGAYFLYAEPTVAQPSFSINRATFLNTSNNFADIVILTHADFLGAAGQLRSHRVSQGYQVSVVNVEDVFDEFNFGLKSSQAIKDFLSNARTTWTKPPRFVVLLGDATFDTRNYIGLGDADFVPTKLVDTTLLETASDDWFTDFNNDAVPDLPVGRLPVRTASDAGLVVSKLINYDRTLGDWRQKALLVADVNDGYDFGGALAGMVERYPATLTTTVLDAAVNGPDLTRTQIQQNINSGCLLVNYLGHGSPGDWSKSRLLSVNDALALSNGSKLPFVVSMNCLNGYWHDIYTDSLGEALLKSPNGGAVGVWTSSGSTLTLPQIELNQAFLQFFPNSETVGEAVMRAKALTSDNDVRRTWAFLGDPTTRVR